MYEWLEYVLVENLQSNAPPEIGHIPGDKQETEEQERVRNKKVESVGLAADRQ